MTGWLRLCAIGFVLTLGIASTAKANQPPNFIIIMADDLGYGDISSYGGWIETPNLDRLATEGLRFTDFHSSGVVCSPTRAGLLTGRYQQRAGIPGVVLADPSKDVHTHGLATREITFAEVLHEQGYTTAMYGKWHLGYLPVYNPVHHGFDDFRGYVSGNIDFFSHVDQAGVYDWWHGSEQIEEEGYVTHLIDRHALSFIRENRDGPFCLYLPHEAPHSPYQGPADEPRRKVGAGNGADQRWSAAERKERYRQMVQAMDQSIGNIMRLLDELGIADNTLILFFSDNGASRNGSNAPLRGHKGSVWEGGHRVPAIALWPGRIPAGTTTDQLAITLDIMPTVLALAGATIAQEHQLDGVDLSPVLFGTGELPDRPLFWNGVAVRDGPWKLITKAQGMADGPGLFNLDEDPGEQNNLAASQPDRMELMITMLEAWRTDVARGATRQPGEQ